MFEPDWERHCAEPAVEAVRRATGRDLWAELGGCPRTWKEAAALYRRCGGCSLSDVVTAALGPPVAPKQARRGDVCIMGNALGICRGDLVEYPNATFPLSQAEKAWRVDRRPK